MNSTWRWVVVSALMMSSSAWAQFAFNVPETKGANFNFEPTSIWFQGPAASPTYSVGFEAVFDVGTSTSEDKHLQLAVGYSQITPWSGPLLRAGDKEYFGLLRTLPSLAVYFLTDALMVLGEAKVGGYVGLSLSFIKLTASTRDGANTLSADTFGWGGHIGAYLKLRPTSFVVPYVELGYRAIHLPAITAAPAGSGPTELFLHSLTPAVGLSFYLPSKKDDPTAQANLKALETIATQLGELNSKIPKPETKPETKAPTNPSPTQSP